MIIEWIHYCTGVSHSMWVNECSGLLCKSFRFSVFLIHQNWSLDSLAKGDGSLINYQIGSLYWLMRKAHLYALAAGVKTIHSKNLKCCICGALHSGNNNQQPAPRSARQQLYYFFMLQTKAEMTHQHWGEGTHCPCVCLGSHTEHSTRGHPREAKTQMMWVFVITLVH